MTLDSKIPSGPIADKWERRKFENKLVNPANRRKYEIIIVGTGLAGSSAAAALGEQGYRVKLFCILDSPRRAHSIAAQGGINAAKNYRNDGDSIYRLFYDTVKGGDYRAREANVYRLAQLSVDIIDQCVATGVPVRARVRRAARQPIVRRRAGVANVLRARADRPAAAARRVSVDAAAGRRGHGHAVPAARDARPGRRRRTGARHRDAQPHHRRARAPRRSGRPALHRRLRHGLLPVDQRGELERDGGMARAQARSAVRQSVLHADSSDLHSGERRPSVEADADVGEPAKRRPRLGSEEEGRQASAGSDSRNRSATTTSNGVIPSFGNLVPRDVASRAAKQQSDEGFGVGDTGLSVYLDFKEAIERLGIEIIKARYGNLFEMYERITAEDPYKVPMRIYPAIHYTMGGLWVDYNLESTIPGLFVMGEANFSDHGANRLGASALMQGLADGYFIAPYTVANYLASAKLPKLSTDHDAFKEAASTAQARIDKVLRRQRQAHRQAVPPAARPHHVGLRRHGAQRAGAEGGAAEDPHASRASSGRTSSCPARRTTSTRCSTTRAAWPTTWSSASS